MKKKDIYKFMNSEAKTPSEIALVEMKKNLNEIMLANINLYKSEIDETELFHCLYNAIFAFTGEWLFNLVKMLAIKEQKTVFIKDCENLFKVYMKDIKDNL